MLVVLLIVVGLLLLLVGAEAFVVRRQATRREAERALARQTIQRLQRRTIKAMFDVARPGAVPTEPDASGSTDVIDVYVSEE